MVGIVYSSGAYWLIFLFLDLKVRFVIIGLILNKDYKLYSISNGNLAFLTVLGVDIDFGLWNCNLKSKILTFWDEMPNLNLNNQIYESLEIFGIR